MQIVVNKSFNFTPEAFLAHCSNLLYRMMFQYGKALHCDVLLGNFNFPLQGVWVNFFFTPKWDALSANLHSKQQFCILFLFPYLAINRFSVHQKDLFSYATYYLDAPCVERNTYQPQKMKLIRSNAPFPRPFLDVYLKYHQNRTCRARSCGDGLFCGFCVSWGIS